MQRNFFETLVGLLVLGLGGFLLFYALKNTQSHGENYKHIHAAFERVDGISEGNDVKMGGIKIGQVATMRLDPKSLQATLVLAIDPTIPLPKDSSASIASESLLGGKFVDIVPGGDDQNLEQGDHLHHTQSSVNIEKLIGKMIFSGQE